MTTMVLSEKYAEQLDGVLHCYESEEHTSELQSR